MAKRRIRQAPSVRATLPSYPSGHSTSLFSPGSKGRANSHSLLRLQRQFGNRYVQRIVSRALASGTSAGAAAVQRQPTPAPACPTVLNFAFTGALHVPHWGTTPPRATTNVTGVTWSLEPDTASVDPGSSIAANGSIHLAPTQPAGTIKARATGTGGCFFERPFDIQSQPIGIASTSMVNMAGGSNYGAIFDHVFISADGNVASLENVGVGERFTNVPSPAAAVHALVAPLYPFGGTFTLHTATLTPTASNNWFLTAAGGLGGTLDTVTIGQTGINAGRFVQSASNPSPPQGLPAGFTVLQSLHWFCEQKPAANRWTPFVTVAHSRTLRNVGGVLEFVTTVNGIEHVDPYVGAAAVFNLTATPVSTPRSAAPPATPSGAGPPPARTVRVRADTLPATLPAGQPLTWAIIGPAHGCSVAADPADAHAAILTIGRSAGTVTVQAADASGANRARVAVVVT
jgi:hypothetical protein